MSKPYSVIFVDMDGVLADFNSAVLKLFKYKGEPPKGEYDLCKVLGVSKRSFWKTIGKEKYRFWPHLATYSWAERLITEVSKLADEVRIASSPAYSSYCYSGKWLWLQQPRNRFMSEIPLILIREKHLLAVGANPNERRALIDDSPDNIKAFREAGGVGVLFPQPWNDPIYTLSPEDPVDHVLNVLKNYPDLCGRQTQGKEDE